MGGESEGEEEGTGMIKSITKAQYWQIVGLLSLAKPAIKTLDDIEKSIRSLLAVTSEDDAVTGIGDPAHIQDAIYNDYYPEKLLGKLGIKVAKTWEEPAERAELKKQK